MFLKHLRDLTKTIGFRTAAWYSTVFLLSSLFLFLFSYYFLSATLKRQDYERILFELGEVSSLYEIGGIQAIQDSMAAKNRTRGKNPLFVRVADKANKTRYVLSSEQWQDFDLGRLETIIPQNGKVWIHLSALKFDYVLDICSKQLSGGFWLQAGISSEGRDKVLEHFREVFWVVVIPILLVGLAGGWLFSSRTMKPIRDIIQTVQSIDIGSMTSKVPRTMTGDELDDLARLFNQMLANIQDLIAGMKNSLDTVAHDLRTPMTRLRNMSEMALHADSDSGLFREALEKGIEESDRILKMLDTIMDISEAETGVMTLDRQIVNLALLLEKVADLYLFVAEEKGIDFQLDSQENLYAAIDYNRISQALANILDNAIKFTPAGGHVRLEAHRAGNEILIKIKDTGTGIRAEQLPRIWDRLYRGDQNRSGKGLGLGLSLVKGIVKAHNGRAEVVSEFGRGSTFIIALPAIP